LNIYYYTHIRLTKNASYGGNDDAEVDFNELFLDKLGGRARLWVVPDVGHTGGFDRYPDDYEARVIAFFEAMLLGITADTSSLFG
jgi:hypothetical protein